MGVGVTCPVCGGSDWSAGEEVYSLSERRWFDTWQWERCGFRGCPYWILNPPRLVVRDRVPYDEIGDAYRRADAFIFTGLRDSGGGQFLEAMAYGLPVICPDDQGAAQLVEYTWDRKARQVPVAAGMGSEPKCD